VTIFGLEISSGLVALGLITGMTYGILAVGIVLVYRSNRVVNFAHGEIGALGAAVCGLLVVRWSVPYWIALLAAIAASAACGAATEVAVVRRLRKAPRLMSLVATLGVAQFLLAFSALLNNEARSASTFPQPPGLPEFRVGALLVTRAYSGMLLLSPLMVLALVLFLTRTRYGLAMRASAANGERALMAGVPVGRMSTVAWALAGGVAAVTTVLIIPTRGFITAETLGPVLLLRALAPAVVARMTSLPVALGAGVAIGLVDEILVFNYPTSGVSEIVLLAVIVIALLFQSRRGSRQEESQDWGIVQPWPVLSDRLQAVWSIRNLGRITGAVAVAGAIILGAVSSNSTAVTLVAIAAFSLIGLSLGVVTGLGGQLSLGQFALAGVGAAVSSAITHEYGNYFAAIFVAAVVVGAVSMVIGLPALRVRGLLLGVVTLSFALAAQRWLLGRSWLLGDGIVPGRPIFRHFVMSDTRRYYYWALGVLVVGFMLARNVWRGGIGLRLRAVRDNEDGARAFGVSAVAVKLQAFAIAGVLVGMAGSVYGHLLSRVSPSSFDVVTSIRTVALTVLGGIGMLSGPLLGAFYIIGIPRFLPLDNAGLAATALGWLVLILYFPGGIAQVVAIPRARIIAALARRAGVDPDEASVWAEATDQERAIGGVALEAHTSVTSDHQVLLTTRGLEKHYGGLRAVDGVDLELQRGEILGVIGPNGAGKTTLFEIVGGFVTPDAGTVEFAGRDVTRLRPEGRARLGLIRSFQDARLFPTLTVTEAITLAYERLEPTSTPLSALGVQRAERSKRTRAREVLQVMGLEPYRDTQIRELSTGTRRITELACIVALEPTVLLLDEPSSGIAQRESEALGGVLLRLRDHLDCTLMIIEHDIPLLMGLSTRVMAMDVGKVIAVGSPAEVRRHPLVVESYLGGNVVAIERSGAATDGSAQCSAVTRAGHRCTRKSGPDGVCGVHRGALAASR
jgi:ABC-type branched-subunit amino acid transport system ATPase component/ABC-type branched-subunit amino acid transport system permease subunit